MKHFNLIRRVTHHNLLIFAAMLVFWHTNSWQQVHAQTADLTVRIHPMAATAGRVDVNPRSTSRGGTITLPTWQVSNIGNADASTFTIGYYLSTDPVITAPEFRGIIPGHIPHRISNIAADIKLGDTIVTLLAGSSLTLTAREFTIPSISPGDYYVGVLVDESNSIPELGESNNQVLSRSQLHVNPSVNTDLVPGAFNIQIGDTRSSMTRPAVAGQGAAISVIGWSVFNLGAEDAPAFSVGFYLSSDSQISRDDKVMKSVEISNGVRASSSFRGDEFTFHLPPEITPGMYYFIIFVDNTQQVDELLGVVSGQEYNNNTQSIQVRVVPGPSDTMPVSRVQLILTTANVRKAHTGDPVYARLNSNNITWMDYARDDFERGHTDSYDLILNGISNLGDIQYIELGKEGTNGWCVSKIQVIVNNVPIFSRDYPNGRWIDPPRRGATLRINYSELRSSAEWQNYQPSRITEYIYGSDLESIMESIVGHILHSKSGYWGNAGGVWVSRASDSCVHSQIKFKVSGPGATEFSFEVNFNMCITCACGLISTSVTGLKVDVSSNWLMDVSGIVDEMQKEVRRSLEAATANFNQSVNLGLDWCPDFYVFPDGTIQFKFPAFFQDLHLSTSMYPTKVRPGDTVTIKHSVKNFGNQASNPFTTTVYLVAGTDLSLFKKTTRGKVLFGIRLGGSGIRPGREACTESDIWTQDFAIPASLECSSVGGSGQVVGDTLVPQSLPSFDRDQRRYFLIVELQSQGDSDSINNFGEHLIFVGLPDLESSRLTIRPSQDVRAGSIITVAPGTVVNLGLFTSSRLRYGFFLSDQPMLGDSAYWFLEKERPGLWPGEEFGWITQDFQLPPTIVPGRYWFGFYVGQIDGSPECDLNNNLRLVPLWVQP